MNEELQQAIVAVIESMTGVAQSAYSFGAEQLPDVVQQLILFNLIKSGTLFALSLFVLWLWVYAAYRQIKTKPQPGEYARDGIWWDVRQQTVQPQFDGAWTAWAVFGGTAAICALIVAISYGLEFLKIAVAPKVWLIEYAAGLVK
jgi:hypothetical protein